MMKRRKGKYILVARYENVFAGLRYWGVMFWSRAVVWEARKAIWPCQVVFTYGCVSGYSPGDSRHGFHIVIGEVYEEAFGVFVLEAWGERFPSSFDLHPAFPPV